MPEFRPPSFVRNAGSSLSRVSTSRASRRSAKPANTAIASATWSRAPARARLRLQGDDAVVVRLGRAPEGLEGHRRGDLRVLEQREAVVDHQGADAPHDGRAVDDRDPLLRLEGDRREARTRERLLPRK